MPRRTAPLPTAWLLPWFAAALVVSAAEAEGLPGGWRPFADGSPWNRSVADLPALPGSAAWIAKLEGRHWSLDVRDPVTVHVRTIDGAAAPEGRRVATVAFLETEPTFKPDRPSGFPLIAGLLRPEEVRIGEIRHALAFTLENPDLDGDGSPDWGVRLRLAADADPDSWNLTAEGEVVVRALREYGAVLVGAGRDGVLQTQRLGPSAARHRAAWEGHATGLFRCVERIPMSAFVVVERMHGEG